MKLKHINPTRLGIPSFLMLIAISLGAMGAHALESKISAEQLESFKTGVLYLLIHAIALIALSGIIRKLPYTLLLGGAVLFSFSIFLLATRDLIGIESWVCFLGPITPLGGLLMISGWALLTYEFLLKGKNSGVN
ncbi:MAG: DUF423 domain-containing protein [Luteibaculum sp.]